MVESAGSVCQTSYTTSMMLFELVSDNLRTTEC